MMPDGLLKMMSDDDIRDLIAYLGTPRQVPLPKAMTPETSTISNEYNPA